MRNIMDRVPLADLIKLARRKLTEDISVAKIARDYNKSVGLRGADRVTPSDLREALRTVPSKHEAIRQDDIRQRRDRNLELQLWICLLYTSPSPRDQRGSRMPSSA